MDPADSRRLVEAAAWRVHLVEQGVQSSREFEAWLSEDPRNAEAWQGMQSTWDLVGEFGSAPEVLALRSAALDRLQKQSRKRSRGLLWRRHATRLAVAAGIGVVVLGALLFWNLTRPLVFRTAVGELRSVTLADGSRVYLDASTELQARLSSRSRELQLLSGQARFDVAHDVARPFSVEAHGRKVVATGTAFNIDVLGDNVTVTMIEGKVVVLPPRAAAGAADGIDLVAGQQLHIDPSGSTRVGSAGLKRALAWQSGQLVIDDESFASVVSRINRYTTRPLRVGDAKAASLRISGVFDASDTRGFVTTLTQYLPLAADYSRPDVILIRSR